MRLVMLGLFLLGLGVWMFIVVDSARAKRRLRRMQRETDEKRQRQHKVNLYDRRH
jgi:hypothetical protein